MEHAVIRLKAGEKTPFYEQIYAYFAAAIRSGALAAGEKLPSKRRLAQDVGVSISTVETAYAMLVAEGYLEAKPRSGFRVCSLSALQRPVTPAPSPAEPVQTPPRFDFSTGRVDTTLFPFAAWRRLQRQVLAGDEAVLRAGCAQGDEALRQAIATHLAEFRGVRAEPRQIVVGAGSEYLTGLLAQLFPGAVFAVEEPGYTRTPRVLANCGATVAYVAVDAVGNSSDPATVKIKIEKPNTKVTYADMDGDPAHKAAIRLAEEGIFVGECMGGAYFFQPDAAVTRGEFVAMAMNAAGMEALEDVERTGFADDVSIPTWAKPYVSSALKAGLVQGSRSSDGQVVFQAEEPITAAEAAVLLDRALQVTDVSADTLAEEGIPTWAAQSAANLATCGVLSLDGGLSAPLTRGEAAELLCGALELQDSRDGGWF